jgi:hypothetical protein
MSLWSKFRGTAEAYWQLGFGGPQLKAASGVVEARNSADTAYAVVRGADPSAASDLATKTYVDARSTAPTETDSDTSITGGGGSQAAGSHTLPTDDNRILILGCRLWIYQRSDFSIWGWADYRIGLRRSGGTWTIKAGTNSPIDFQLPTGFLTSAVVSAGNLVINVTPGASNCYATVEDWRSTIIVQTA